MIIYKSILSIILGSFTLILALLFIPTPAYAVTIPTVEVTRVSGIVIGKDGHPLKFARVFGTCDGKTSRGITNGQGKYQLIFVGREVCAAGAHVHVTVSDGDQNAAGDGIVVLNKDGRYVDMNLSLTNVNFNVPEYSTLIYILTILLSISIYVGIRSNKFSYIYTSKKI